MSGPVCPNCNRALPPTVVNGPAQAVVRCEGCQTLLLWSNGRVMRSARSATPTIMGMPAATGAPPPTPPAQKAPPPPRREEPSRVEPLPELMPEEDDSPAVMTAPPKPLPPRAPPPKPAPPKTPPPRSGQTQPLARVVPQKVSVTGLGDGVPTKVAAPPPELLRKEAAAPSAKPSPSAPIKVGPATPAPKPVAKPAAPPVAATTPPPASAAPTTPATADASKHVVVAAVAEVPAMAPGPMVDPSAWFAESSDVVPPEKVPPLPAPPPAENIESSRPARRDTTGAAPLPPPPSLPSAPEVPFIVEAPDSGATPATGTMMPEMRAEPSAPIATRAKETSAPIAVTAKETSAPIAVKAREPSAPVKLKEPAPPRRDPTPMPKRDPLPSLSTTIGAAPTKPEPKPAPAPVAKAVNALPADSKPEPPVVAPEPTPPPSREPMSQAATMAANAPAAVGEREPSVQPLPPPPAAPEQPVTNEIMMPTTSRVARAPRRSMLMGGVAAAAVLLLVVVALALSRGSKQPATTHRAPAPTAPVAVAPTPPPEPTPTPAVAEPTPEPAPPPEPPRPRRTLGGKKVVLEYDPKPTAPAPPPATAPTPMGEDPAVVARAREAYHNGNVKLFAGDDDGAIALYRESLKIYPGYVAGYRGLGLAFEAKVDREEALKAFKTYVRTVPNAVDASIIRKRIDRLEAQKSGAAPPQ